MSQIKEIQPNPQALDLDPLTLPLCGRHLIEASAGTGKTYSITRLYVRLLVEKRLSVQEILVMTFTDAATEEIRSRVADFINEVLNSWDSEDLFVAHIKQVEGARTLLESAKLTIDDASIFTIHGFCQRVISQFSASMQVNPEAKILPQTKERFIQAIADCIIGEDKNSADFARLQANKWHTPSQFYTAFSQVLMHDDAPRVLTPADVWEDYVESSNKHWQAEQGIRAALIKALQTLEPWLDGLKRDTGNSQKNTHRIISEIESAVHFLNRSELIDKSENERVFELFKQSDFSINATKEIIDAGLVTLFGTARSKKYDQQWFAPLQTYFDTLISPIKKVLTPSNYSSLNKQFQQCIAYQTAAKLIVKVKENMANAMQKEHLRSYDDLIRTVYDALLPTHNKMQAAFIRSQLVKQFPVALVDEFQDTDHQQYSIFTQLYGNSTGASVEGTEGKECRQSALIMIGDPKQAIYGFRGGDVFTYLQARQDADYLWTMDTNWRSTPDMVAAYNFIFSHHTPSVFDYSIDYLPVQAAQGNLLKASSLRLNDDTNIAALQCVCADVFNAEDDKLTTIEEQQQQILDWMVMEIQALLYSGQIDTQDGTTTALQAKDIAVLVRSGREAQLVKRALQREGIASVYLSEKSPLFDSPHAQNVYDVLLAIWTGNNQRRCITALATGIFYANTAVYPHTSELIAQLIKDHAHPEWQQVFKQNAQYKEIWQQDGIYSLLSYLIAESFDIGNEGLEAERALTNYQHLAELMAKAAVMHTTPSAQLIWLARQLNYAQEDDTSQLRLESDQALVKVITQHKSKGLEYPVVFLPFANSSREFKPKHILKYHDADKQLIMQLGKDSRSKKAMEREDLAEDIRLLYVALTRPIYRAYLGFTLNQHSHRSAIHRALALPDVLDDMSAADSVNYGTALAEALKTVFEHSDAAKMRVRMASEAVNVEARSFDTAPAKLELQSLDRDIVQRWVLTSFTGISRLMHTQKIMPAQAPVFDEGSTRALGREPEAELALTDLLATDKGETLGIATPVELRFSIAKGADTGNLLHDTLEWLSFETPDFDGVKEKLASRHSVFAKLNSPSESADSRKHSEENLQQDYFDWIEECLGAPLSPCLSPCQYMDHEASSSTNSSALNPLNATSLSLRKLPDSALIKEAEFYLPIENLDFAALAELLKQHRARVAAQFGFTAIPVSTFNRASIAGMLHGFIDLSFQWHDKFYVCDYKSTFMGADYADYSMAKVAKNIQEHDYDLQYLLYSMALERYLQQSLNDYDTTKHFGGVYYLYLRGMSANSKTWINHQSPGVFYTPILEQELAKLHSLFGQAHHQKEGV